MTQEQIFGAACASNPYSLVNEPQVAGAFHEGFEQGARWHLNIVEEAFKQLLREHVAFTVNEGNREALQ